jgi:hypothetical protein
MRFGATTTEAMCVVGGGSLLCWIRVPQRQMSPAAKWANGHRRGAPPDQLGSSAPLVSRLKARLHPRSNSML